MASNAFTAKVGYEVFLSYNSADYEVVEDIARKLRDEGLEPFLDRWYLGPGTPWRSKLEDTLSSCKAVAIFVGPREMGSWQQREVDVALDLQSRNPNLPVIPVLLPGCEPPLGFLRQLTWVDLRTRPLDLGVVILAKAARGEAPGPDLRKQLDSVRASICPYRGLLHFREEDAPFFFGREVAIDKLVSAVQRQPFVAVVGASGSGKSSVVRAGLVPNLRRHRRTTWEAAILVPSDEPLKALAGSLVPLLEPTMREVDRLVECAKLAENLGRGTVSLHEIVKRILEKQSGTDRLLIVVDQFEELFTLTTEETARRRFLDELLAASSRAGSKTNVVLTLRGDFVGKALAYRPLSDRLQDAQINLGPMTREELECAILNPAEKIPLEFEPGLANRILKDVGDEPGNLPLLEFVLKELWDKRRGRVLLNETYDAIGGLQGAVATKADELFNGLTSAEQKVLKRIFLRIVRPSESGLDTRRRAAFTELPPEAAELVLDLTNQRLLVTNQSASGLEQTVEVAHEALISNWSTLRAWVNEDREFLLWRVRLGALLTEWERAQESEEALLRGPLLIEAQKWFDQRSQDLSDQERKFISASRALRERLAREEKERRQRELEAAERLAEESQARLQAEAQARREAEQRSQEQLLANRQLRRRGWALLAFAVMASGLAAFAFIAWQEAVKQQKISRSDEVAASALLQLSSDPEFAMLLAMEAAKIWPTTQAEEMLRRSLVASQVRGELCPHKALSTAVFSPDGKLALTMTIEEKTKEQTAQFWDVASGKGISFGEEELRGAAFSPAGNLIFTESRNGVAQLWELQTRQSRALLRDRRGEVTCAVFSPNGKFLFMASDDKTAGIWDVATGKRLPEVWQTGIVRSAAFKPDGSLVITADENGKCLVWKLGTTESIRELAGHFGTVTSITFSPDGRFLVTACGKGLFYSGPSAHNARLWKVDSWTSEWLEAPDRVYGAAFSPDSRLLATAHGDDIARLWDTNTGRLLKELHGHTNWVWSTAFSPDGSLLVTAGSYDGTARVWSVSTGEPIFVLQGHTGFVRSAMFSLDGTSVITASDDQTARIWAVSAGRKLDGLPHVRMKSLLRAAFSHNGRFAAGTAADNSARIWDVASGRSVADMFGHRAAVVSADFSPDDKLLVTASEDGTARVWDTTTGKPIYDPLQHGARVNSAVFSHNGRWILTASDDTTARVWDAATGTQIRQMPRHARACEDAVFSPDDKLVVTAIEDNSVELWEVRSGEPATQPLRNLSGHTQGVYSAAFDKDGGRVVTAGGSENLARLWDSSTGRPLSVLRGHASYVWSAAFSPNGRFVVTASADQTARVWDVATSEELAVFRGNTDDVTSAVFSPDGKHIITESIDGTMRIYDFDAGGTIEELMALADRRAIRELTAPERAKFLHELSKK